MLAGSRGAQVFDSSAYHRPTTGLQVCPPDTSCLASWRFLHRLPSTAPLPLPTTSSCRERIEGLQRLEDEGWELEDPVADDWGHIRREPPAADSREDEQ